MTLPPMFKDDHDAEINLRRELRQVLELKSSRGLTMSRMRPPVLFKSILRLVSTIYENPRTVLKILSGERLVAFAIQAVLALSNSPGVTKTSIRVDFFILFGSVLNALNQDLEVGAQLYRAFVFNGLLILNVNDINRLLSASIEYTRSMPSLSETEEDQCFDVLNSLWICVLRTSMLRLLSLSHLRAAAHLISEALRAIPHTTEAYNDPDILPRLRALAELLTELVSAIRARNMEPINDAFKDDIECHELVVRCEDMMRMGTRHPVPFHIIGMLLLCLYFETAPVIHDPKYIKEFARARILPLTAQIVGMLGQSPYEDSTSELSPSDALVEQSMAASLRNEAVILWGAMVAGARRFSLPIVAEQAAGGLTMEVLGDWILDASGREQSVRGAQRA